MKDEALRYHEEFPGKIGTAILTKVEGKEDLSLAYSPGVAEPCLEIAEDKDKVYDYTSKGNSVAVISNGSAVLGLGNIGSLAGKPVMEGKALLFKHFADIDAVDVEVDSEDVEKIVQVVELIGNTYGGINLEDFKAPECFEIERRLKEKLGIPVFHDDQHGTAVVVGAGLMSALKRVGKSFGDVKVVVNGAGAAGIAIIKMLLNLGVERDNLFVCDMRGLIVKGGDYDESKLEFARDESEKGLGEVVVGADVFVGVSAADVLSVEMLKSMAKDRIVFALANPNPEIDWDVAHGACDDLIMATGRSDFPNQVNNVLAFPGIFRGALDVRASEISEEMKVAAVGALAGLVEEGRIIPDVFDKRVVVEVAVAVAGAAGVDGFDLGKYRERLERRFLSEDNIPNKAEGSATRSSSCGNLIGKRFGHYKGKGYEVVDVCFDADDCRRRVVYRALYDDKEFGENAVWVRDWDEFFGEVEVCGERVKRFAEIED